MKPKRDINVHASKLWGSMKLQPRYPEAEQPHGGFSALNFCLYLTQLVAPHDSPHRQALSMLVSLRVA